MSETNEPMAVQGYIKRLGASKENGLYVTIAGLDANQPHPHLGIFQLSEVAPHYNSILSICQEAARTNKVVTLAAEEPIDPSKYAPLKAVYLTYPDNG